MDIANPTVDNFQVIVTDVEKVTGGLNRFANLTKKEMKIELQKIVRALRDDIVFSMVHTQKNMASSYYKNGQKYNPSLPGQPPAIATGNLEKAINYRVNVGGTSRVYGTATLFVDDDRADYIEYLEYGTEKMDERPSIYPAFERMELETGLNMMMTRIIHAY